MEFVSTFMRYLIALVITVATASRISADEAQPAPPKPPSVRSLAFSPDGKSVAVIYANLNSLVVWDLQLRAKTFDLREKSGFARVAYSPSGKNLVAATGKVIKVFDPASGKVLRELTGHDDNIRCLAFTADGKLITGGKEGTIKLWNLASGDVLRTFEPKFGEIISVAASADGRWLAAAGNAEKPYSVLVWNLPKPQEPPRKFEYPNYVPQILFSPDAKFLAVPHWGGRLCVIAMASGDEAKRYTNMGGARWAAFSPDGRRLAIATGRLLELVDIPANAGRTGAKTNCRSYSSVCR